MLVQGALGIIWAETWARGLMWRIEHAMPYDVLYMDTYIRTSVENVFQPAALI